MGKNKLEKFADMRSYPHVFEYPYSVIDNVPFEMKGRWKADFFKNDHPIVLELGCGRGEYTVGLARKYPDKNFIGVDIKGARLWKGAKYATQHSLPNVAFLRTRVEFISAFFAPGEVSEIWLTFSDPQFRSENSRLSSPVFLGRYRSFLKPGGLVHLKTDSRFLHEYTKAVCKVNGLELTACTADLYGDVANVAADSRVAADFKSAATTAATAAAEATAVQTFYEKMFLEQGYPITYMAFRLDHDGPFAAPRDPEDFDSDHWRSVEGPRVLFGRDTAETRRQKLKK